MLKYFFIHLLFLITHISVAQELSGIIRDKDTKKPIEYATITANNKNLGVYSNSQGEFKVSWQTKTQDTLVVSALGYQKIKVLATELAKNGNIYLANEVLETVIVKAKKGRKKSLSIGDFRRETFLFPYTNYFMSGGIGSVYLRYFSNPEKRKGLLTYLNINLEPRIASYNFITKKYEDDLSKTTTIKVRVLSVNPQSKAPDKELVQENILYVIKNPRHSRIDLRKYKIPFPENGFFAGFEIMNCEGCPQKLVHISIPLRNVRENEEKLSWNGYMNNGRWFLSNRNYPLGVGVKFE